MKKLSIVTYPEAQSLRERSRELSKKEILGEEIQSLIQPMLATMHGDDGIGLAAPQVGHNIRMIVVGKAADEDLTGDIVLFNPTWEKTAKATEWDTEGCLSVPNIIGTVKRYTDIEVKALNQQGEEVVFDAYDYFARVIQHEVDHIDGILFIDKSKDLHKIDPLTKEKTPFVE